MKSVRIPKVKRLKCFLKPEKVQRELDRERYRQERRLNQRRRVTTSA